ncbi:MAG: hypothetical protein HKN99_03110 [Winogradskyella sp.]|nr:hypothetical protein [Winogradskyella sp.]
MNKNVVVVDLDGTLYSINTFHHYLKFIFIKSISTIRFWLSVRLIMLFIRRILGFVSHAEMKYRVLSWTANYNIDHQKFASSIKKYHNNLHNLETNTFHHKILATAAPSCYASIIATNHGFNHCVATTYTQEGITSFVENSKEAKKENVTQLLKSLNLNEINTLITDHIDDLPLMKISKEVILINPSSELIKELNDHNIKFKSELH